MTAQEELILFSGQWDEAMIGNNVEEIGKFMAEDWIIIGTEGGITSRDSFLDHIRKGDLSHHTMSADQLECRIYGNTGVIVSRGTSAGHYKGQPFSFYEWSTSVFVKTGGRWTCVTTMLTPALPANS